MLLKPNELKLHSLAQIPPGTLVSLVGREDDIPLAIRLADNEKGPRLFLLGGSYSYHVADWDAEQLAHIVCAVEHLLFNLDSQDDNGRQDPGTLTLQQGGAFLTGTVQGSSHARPRFNIIDWKDAEKTDGRRVTYSTWEVGKLDHRGEYIALFKAGA